MKIDWRKNIEGLIVSYVSGRKQITINQIIGQMQGAINRNRLDIKDCYEVIEKVREGIKGDAIYPGVAPDKKKEMLEKLDELEKQVELKLKEHT